MGYWESFQSAMEELKRRSPGLDSFKDACRTSYGIVASSAAVGSEGACNLYRSAAAGAARVASSALPPMKGACRHGWDYTSWAAGELDRAVRVEGPRWMAQWMPEAEERRKIARVLSAAGMKAADVVISESARSVPGGLTLYREIKQGAAEINGIQTGSAAASAMQRKVARLEAELADLRARNAVMGELLKNGGAPAVATRARRPEDVIGAFVQGVFKGGDFLDALLVPVPGGKRGGGSPGKPPC